MRTIALVIALFSLTTVFAANNNEDKLKSFSISGKVVDNNESLTGVKILLDGKETVIYTDFDGNFTLENVLAGEHTISFSLITYNNKEVTFNPSKENNLEIELETK
ncbi:MAG: carboxypeptidase-like regulatory domain-containing protein [Flavobacteriales bacterium]|nr:carboxypeptidase-like regulatory domain-containing protein [Flavobacteriales bacterium]